MPCLEDFPRANRVRRGRDGAADLGGGKTRRQLQGIGEQAIAKKHGDFTAPFCRQGGQPASNLRLIDDIVMNEGGQMHHLDDDRHGDVILARLAQGLGGKRYKAGRKCFP